MLTLSVLVFLLAFVFERGIMVVLENLTLSAGTVTVLLATALFALLRTATVRPTVANGTDRVAAFVNLTVASLLALATLGFVLVIGTNLSISAASITVEPTAVVGAVPGLIAGGVVFGLTRESGEWRPESGRGRSIRRAFRAALLVAGGIGVLELVAGLELAVAGIGAVSVLLGGVVVAALLVAAVRPTDERTESDQVIPPVSWLGRVAVTAFLLACLRVFATGFPVGLDQAGIVASGTIDWPFITNPSQGLGIQPGVMPAMFGTIWIVIGAVTFAVPLAVGSAVFLTEYAEDSIFTRAVDIATNGLWSTPSIVFGLFGLAFIVPRFGNTPSILAAQLVLGFMLLPLVLITSREAMKSVPDEYRDASAALGVSKWQTIRSVVVPASMPGVITGVILGVGRIAGETAPLLLVLNGPAFPNSGPKVLSSFLVRIGADPPFIHVSNPALMERASALPYQLYAVITAGVGAEQSFGWGTALVLLGVVLGFFLLSIATRRYFRRKLHQ
nr:phosphate ABC transporter permease PstA [Halovenus carboxidivorans]